MRVMGTKKKIKTRRIVRGQKAEKVIGYCGICQYPVLMAHDYSFMRVTCSHHNFYEDVVNHAVKNLLESEKCEQRKNCTKEK